MPAEQVDRLALKIVSQLPRDIGERALRVGFPEPAAAAVLELVDEAECLACLSATRGELPTTIAVIAETIVFTRAKGGEPIETIAPIPMPAHMMICEAEIAVVNGSSRTLCPNQVHRTPAKIM